eukprot:4723142-Pleurochrysis_carterae.AAC.1
MSCVKDILERWVGGGMYTGSERCSDPPPCRAVCVRGGVAARVCRLQRLRLRSLPIPAWRESISL